VVKCNVPRRGWINGVGGCPNVGGICMACTMPSFPDRYMPFMEPDRWGNAAANFQRLTYGPVFRYLRKRNLQKRYDIEPEWRHSQPQLTSGYEQRW
jgi:hydrogenase small subunit